MITILKYLLNPRPGFAALLISVALLGCGGGTSGSGGTNVVDLQGQVLNSSSAGVPNVDVTLGDASGIVVASATTNNAGRFSFLSIPQRSGEVRVTLPANGGQTRVLYDSPVAAREVVVTIQQQTNGTFRNSVSFRRRDGRELDEGDQGDDEDDDANERPDDDDDEDTDDDDTPDSPDDDGDDAPDEDDSDDDDDLPHDNEGDDEPDDDEPLEDDAGEDDD